MSGFKYLGLCLIIVSYGFSDYGRCGTINGVELPCFRDFLGGEGDRSLPYYPYAKRENGCSIPGGPPGQYDNFASGGFDFSFKEACNQHDRCYYRLGSNEWECNKSLAANTALVCTEGIWQAPNWYDLLGGVPRISAVAACYARAIVVSAAVTGTQSIFFDAAQSTQTRYFAKVQEYLDENFDGVFPKLKPRLWTGAHGIADRWGFAKLFESNREVYVTHRNNGTFYATQFNTDGSKEDFTWTGGYGVANRWSFADVFGTGRQQYVTHADNGTFYVNQLNRNGTQQGWQFQGYGIADRWAFADVFGTGRQQYVTHRNNGTFYVTQLNADGTKKDWTMTGGHGIADRWGFAKVFGNGTDVYVTHRNDGQFYTTKFNRDGTITNKNYSGKGIADRWAFADLFGSGREQYVTHRNNGEFYATQLNEDGSTRDWHWIDGDGIGDRWAFTDIYGNGRMVFVTQKNSGQFFITQLNEDGTLSRLNLLGVNGIADRYAFANVFGNKSTTYVTHANNGTVHTTEVNNGVVLSESSLSGGMLTYAFDVPSDGNDLTISMVGGTGDADLYVKKGSAPTLGTYDCRPYTSGNTETCSYPGRVGGRYYIMINPYSNYSGVSLEARYKP